MTISRRHALAAAGLAAVSAPVAAAEARATPGRRPGGRVRTGADRQHAAGWSLLRGQKVGVISNPTGVLADLTHVVDDMHAAGIDVVAVFGPEHGFRGSAQAGGSEGTSTDPRTGITVHDAYGADDAAFARMFAAAGVETVVFDIQDVGARFYTYVWTMYQAMRGAAALGLRFVVLDRPNPIGRRVRGPVLDMAQSSGVGLRAIPMNHGMTLGELATMFNAEYLPHETGGATVKDLHVVEVAGWRGEVFAATGLPWVMPSPNMPTPDTALVYAGTCLVEATNMSEGRGTTHPFELVGAPWGDHRLAERMRREGLDGVAFREAWFTPSTSKHRDVLCGGLQVHVTDPARVDGPAVAVHLLTAARDLYPQFGPRSGDKHPWLWLDRLTGTTTMHGQLASGASAGEIIAGWATDERTWERRRRRYLRYR